MNRTGMCCGCSSGKKVRVSKAVGSGPKARPKKKLSKSKVTSFRWSIIDKGRGIFWTR